MCNAEKGIYKFTPEKWFSDVNLGVN